MNKIIQMGCEYLSPNRTVETISITNKRKNKMLYVYNFQGNSFRLFKNKGQLNNFFRGNKSKYKNFDNEDKLDKALKRIDI
jgi:hypothetical protein